MRRGLTVLLALAIVTLAVGAVVYALRARGSRVTGSAAPLTTTPPAASAATSHATPRGDVTIDPRRQQLIGVRTVPVSREAIGDRIRTVGTVRYDETRLADINLKVEGWIRDLFVDSTGQPIQRGQRLFTIYSPDLVNTEQEYLLAVKTREQLQQSTIADARERADQLVASARQRLALWDVSPQDLRALEQTGQAQNAIDFRSPVSGIVIEKQAVQGLHVMPGQSLYKVADLSTVWIEADIYERDLAGVHVGEPATVTADAYPGQRFTGRAIYVYPYLDEPTRTNKVRFAFANRDGRLKPGMYANVELEGRGASGLVVPVDAVLDSGTEQIVFVAKGDGLFEPRHVKVGRLLGDRTQILDGLKDGDRVATGAAFFLDSESQLRAAVQGYEAAPSTGATAPASPGTHIEFRTIPDPPKVGENQLEATVRDATGQPIEDAEVAVQFFMPAMPTMSMPAMRSEAKLAPAGGGIYRGTGQVMTAGKWDVTVTVMRAGQRVGAKQFSVVPR
jgi:RND family efflux transporter MFP subunit